MVVPPAGYICAPHKWSKSVEGRLQGPQAFIPLLFEELVVLRGRGVLDAGVDLGVTSLHLATDGSEPPFTFCGDAHKDQAPPAQETHPAGQDHPAVALLFIEVRDAPPATREESHRRNSNCGARRRDR